MDGYELIMRIQQKMQEDPNFAAKFNELGQKLNSIPGLEQEVMKIAQISDEKKRKKAIDKLPSSARRAINEFMRLINE
ncbi:hypothetical protein [Clostridium sp.]|uniref:hypothetical protein n=1 Tax=Clostridium sp. TaxID=1506 RepID=UPI00399342CB